MKIEDLIQDVLTAANERLERWGYPYKKFALITSHAPVVHALVGAILFTVQRMINEARTTR